VAFVTAGCKRSPVDGSSSVIRIQAPHSFGKGVNQSLSGGMPTDRKACYGVIVNGSGIAVATANSCSLTSGIVAGFAEPGAQLAVEVPKGPSRTIDLYAFLQDVGQDLPCSTFSASLSATQLLKTYKIGSATNINMFDNEVVVEITASFPGLSQNIAVQNSMSVSCTNIAGGSVAKPPFHVSAGAGLAIQQGQTLATGYSIKARLGMGAPTRETSSVSGYKIKVK